MAERKYVTSKLKKLISDESSKDKRDSESDDIGLPLDKLSLGPKKKLLVLGLNGILVHRIHVKDMATVRGLRPDTTYGKFLIFKRPFCTEFLKFCFERFEVGIWSSARDHNIDGALNIITGGMRSKLLFVWSQEECKDSGFFCRNKAEKPLFLKDLKDLWEKKYITKGKYSSSNTLLIDDEPHTCLLNPPNTAIFPDPYKKHDAEDAFLGPNGELRKFLDGLADADVDVPSYVKDHPFGQPAISPSHPDWKYYESIVRKFAKRGSSLAADSSSTDGQKLNSFMGRK